MIPCIWLWTFWLWIDSDTQPIGVIHWYSNTQTNGGYSLVFWYSANGGYLLVLWYPNQWGLFIGTLIPKSGVVHWYSDTQTNGGCSLVFWYPNQGLFIGILIPKSMGVIHWYSDAQSRGYNVTIVIRLLRIWLLLKRWENFLYF